MSSSGITGHLANNMTKQGIDLIKKFEGLRLKAYKPVPEEKYFTVGYGHYGPDVKPDMVITEDEAEELLKKDLDNFVFNVRKAVEGYTTLNVYQEDALVSLCYNIGVANFRRSTLLKKVRKNPNDETIADEFNRWVYGSGRKLPGLVRRRQAEATLYFTKLRQATLVAIIAI